MGRVRRCLWIAVVLGVVAALAPTAPAGAVNYPQTVVVSANPANFTPNVLDGTVMAVVQVGNAIILGGQFTQVSPSGSAQILSRVNLLAFNATTGVISGTFVPSVNGTVKAMAVAPNGTSIFIGGAFNTVNGVTRRRLAELDATTGQLITSWQANANKVVNDMTVRGNRLYVAGEFTTMAGLTRTYLAALDTTTGAVDPNLNIAFSVPFMGTNPWIRKIDVTPDASRLVAIGNFQLANGLDRTQIAMIDLTTTPATVADWETDAFKSLCSSRFISYLKDVDFSPDGSYFAVGNTGANRGITTMCDTASRWETYATGSGIRPTWVDWTGGDSFVSVAVTATAVYVGGHNQYVNQPYVVPNCGFCQAYYPTPGAVHREGLAALDPANGLPFNWDPGRARGEGVFAFLATPQGLWIGSDTNRIGNETHGRIAFMPVAGGETIPSNGPYALPNGFYNFDGNGDMVRRYFDGTTFGPTQTPPTGIDWTQARGVFSLNGVLYMGWSDGWLYARSFDGTSVGPAQQINLHGLEVAPGPDPRYVIPGTSDPIPSLTSQLQNATGMFFDNGWLYYTVAGDPRLYYRGFTPESQVVGANLYVANTDADGVPWENVRGMTLANGQLYFALTDGTLNRVAWVGRSISGSPTAIGGPLIDGYDWASTGMFVFTQSAADVIPPSQPGKPSGVSNAPDSIYLSWAASTDNQSTSITYRIYRDGNSTPIGSVVSSSTTTVSFTDGGLTAGSTHTYTVDALDGSGNPSTMSPSSDPITVTTALFADSFDSGTLAAWDASNGMAIDSTTGATAPPSVRASVTGQSAFLRKNLSPTVNFTCMSMAVNVASHGSSGVPLMRLRTAAGGAIARVSLLSSGVLAVRSDVSGLQQPSGVTLPSGWNSLELCGTVSTSGTWDLYLNGVQIVTAWTADTGTTPIGRVEVGDTGTNTFTANFDDVVVDQTP